MRNKMTDLNNHLFAQLERLGDEDLSNEKMESEIKRAKAVADVAKTIVESAKTNIEAMKILEKAGVDITKQSNPIFELGTNS
jgi:hypothetical protein